MREIMSWLLRRSLGRKATALLSLGLALSLSPTAASLAEENATLTLGACIELALERNNALRQAAAEVQVAEGGYVRSWANILPTVGASMSKRQQIFQQSSTYIGGIRFPLGTTVRQVSNDYSLGGSVNQSIFDPSGFSSWRQSKSSWKSAKEGLRSAEQDIELAVTALFYDVVKNERLVEVSREAHKLSKDQLARSEALLNLGAVPKADVLEARVAVSQSARELIGSENALVISQGRLNLEIGQPVARPATLVYEPTMIPDDLPHPDGALTEALARRPEMRQRRLALDAAGHQKSAARWALWPTIRGSLFYGRSLPVFEGLIDFESLHDLRSEAGWGYSLSLDVPIFDGLVTKGAKISAAGNYQASAEALEQQTRTVELAVREALLNMGAARASVELSDEQIASASENLRLREAMYDHGAATILELIQAQLDLTNARYQAILGETALQYAWKQYQKAMGLDLRTGEPL